LPPHPGDNLEGGNRKKGSNEKNLFRLFAHAILLSQGAALMDSYHASTTPLVIKTPQLPKSRYAARLCFPREIYTLWKIISTDNYDNHFKAITTAMGWGKSQKP